MQAVLARRLAEADPGRLVRHKERQPYVIVATPGVTFRLKDCVLTPMELLEQWDSFTIHSAYYITKHVNASLQRCLGLAPFHVDVSSWYESCPKPRASIHFWPVTRSNANNTMMISSYFGSDKCALCGAKSMGHSRSRATVCADCRKDSVKAIEYTMRQLNITQRSAASLAARCSKCNFCFEDSTTFAPIVKHMAGTTGNFNSKTGSMISLASPLANCICIDCPNLFKRHAVREKELEVLAICQALDIK